MEILSDEILNEISKKAPKLLGAEIKKFREQKKMSQTELAFVVGKYRQYIYKIEKGIVKSNLATISIISFALGISLSQLFENIDFNKFDIK